VFAGARSSGPIGAVYLPRLLYDRAIERWREAAGEHDMVGWTAFMTGGYHLTGAKLSLKRFAALFQQAIPSYSAAKMYLELKGIKTDLEQALEELKKDGGKVAGNAGEGDQPENDETAMRLMQETLRDDIQKRLADIDETLAVASPALRERAALLEKKKKEEEAPIAGPSEIHIEDNSPAVPV
jgi:hypothetical protein